MRRNDQTKTESITCPFTTPSSPPICKCWAASRGILTKAEAHCSAKNIQPEVLLGSRLFPDMLPLSKQIQLASDFAAKGCARLTHSEVPSTPDTEKTFEELQAAAGEDHRLCEVVQAGAVRRRRRRDVTFPAGPNTTHDAEGPAIPQRLLVPEFLLPRRHRPRHLAPKRRRDRQARFPRRELKIAIAPGAHRPAGKQEGVRCNVIAPEFMDSRRAPPGRPGVQSVRRRRREVACAALFLISNKSSYVMRALFLDGGHLAGMVRA